MKDDLQVRAPAHQLIDGFFAAGIRLIVVKHHDSALGKRGKDSVDADIDRFIPIAIDMGKRYLAGRMEGVLEESRMKLDTVGLAR